MPVAAGAATSSSSPSRPGSGRGEWPPGRDDARRTRVRRSASCSPRPPSRPRPSVRSADVRVAFLSPTSCTVDLALAVDGAPRGGASRGAAPREPYRPARRAWRRARRRAQRRGPTRALVLRRRGTAYTAALHRRATARSARDGARSGSRPCRRRVAGKCADRRAHSRRRDGRGHDAGVHVVRRRGHRDHRPPAGVRARAVCAARRAGALEHRAA